MNELSKALSLIKKYCARKATFPILQNVLVELVDGTMSLTTTNLQARASSSFPCVGNPFSTTVNLEKLEKATKDMNDPLAFAFVADRLTVSDGKARVTLATIPVEEFPPKPESGELLGKLDLDGIERVCPFATMDTDRPILMHVLLEVEKGKVKFVACDGFKLGILERTTDLPDMKVLLLATALSDLPKGYTKAKLFSGKDYVTLDFDGLVLTIKTPSDTYPNYNQIIPTSYNSKLVVKVKDWLDAIKAVKIFSEETNGVVKHSVTDNSMTVYAKDQDGNTIERMVGVVVDQLSPSFALNDIHLIATLKACSRENVTVKLLVPENRRTISEDTKDTPTSNPLVFEDGTDWKAVVMPMHLIKD